MNPLCPSCGSGGAHRLGALPPVEVFAGQPARGALPRGCLYRCAQCGLKFRHPVLTAAQYDALYASARSDCWADEPGRRDWAMVEDYLRAHAAADASVLDFGCHTGGLLARLGARYARTGIEINEQAAAIARDRSGAHIVRDLHSLPAAAPFDFAMAIDTVEHFPDPGRVMANLLAVLKPGGTLLVTTGDAENALWRLAGARWWYCFYPEHLAFISERWTNAWLQRSQMRAQLREVRRFRHLRLSPLRYAGQAWLTLPYLLAPRAYAWFAGGARRLLGRDPTVYPPGTGLTRDHLFLAIRKDA